MNLDSIRLAIRFLAPASWLGLVALGLVPRMPRTRSLVFYAASFLASAFMTRLAVEHHQSRSQIACFALAALFIEAVRSRQKSGFSTAFWIVATVASAIGVTVARPLAHRYAVSTW